MATDPEYRGDFISWTRGRLAAVGKNEKGTRDAMFARFSEGTKWEGKSLDEHIEEIRADDTMSEMDKDVKITGLITYYLKMK